MLNNRVPPNSHLRTRASIGAFLNGAVNRLEIEDTPDELLSSRLADKSQRALVATMNCKKRNYFHLKKSFKTTPPMVRAFSQASKVFRTEVVRVCGCISVMRGVVKRGFGGVLPRWEGRFSGQWIWKVVVLFRGCFVAGIGFEPEPFSFSFHA